MLKKKAGQCTMYSPVNIIYVEIFIKKKNNQTNSISTNNLLIYPPDVPLIGVLIN